MFEVVIDASVVVKWFVEEEGSSKALEVRDQYINGELKFIAPELFAFEVLNALRYKGLFSLEELKSVAEALDAFSFELYSLRGKYARLTVDVAHENDITIYDAAYVSLAILKNTCVYTTDAKLKERLKEKYSTYVALLR
ncbi:MAG: type II toxin-antitoxin system VapC family toxin [Thermofilaceae archaeon]